MIHPALTAPLVRAHVRPASPPVPPTASHADPLAAHQPAPGTCPAAPETPPLSAPAGPIGRFHLLLPAAGAVVFGLILALAALSPPRQPLAPRPAQASETATVPAGDEAKEPAVLAHIVLSFQKKEARADLYDTPAGREFAARLPLVLECGDYNHQEKLSYLPTRLANATPPATPTTPTPGLVAYYLPWGSLAIFYHPGRESRDLVPLGRLTSGLEALANTHGDFYLRIDKVE